MRPDDVSRLPARTPGNLIDALDAAAWGRLRQCIEAEMGMDFSNERSRRFEDAVRKVLTRQGSAKRMEHLLNTSGLHGQFLEQIATELTVGESFFFRNEHHFRALREQVLPRILEDNAARRELRVWSAGCATGEEPYSVSILLNQVLRGRGAWQVSVLGTDLNPEFLERAREGVYRQWSFRQTDIHEDRTCFSRQGDGWRVAPAIRDGVRFAYLNLVKDVYPSPLTGTIGLDLILFRNVAIYLKPEVTQAILKRFYRALRPGGWLLLGESDLGAAPQGPFEVRRFDDATFFQKPSRPPAPGEDDPAETPPAVLETIQAMSAGLRATPTPEAVQQPAPHRAGDSVRAQPAARTARPPAASRTGAVRPGPVWERVERCLAERRWHDAEAALAQMPSRKERASMRLRYALALIARAELARARQVLDASLQDEPLLIEAQMLKASFCEEAGDLAAAEQAWRRALYIDPAAPMVHFHLALVLDQRGDLPGKARSLKAAGKLLEGRDPRALVPYGEGVCYARLQDMVSRMSGV